MNALTQPPPRKDQGMEGMVAKWYAANTGRMLDEFSKLARRVADRLPDGASVLEAAPGPGYFCVELAKLGRYSITGLDLSHSFVDMARRNAAAAGVAVEFRQGNVSNLPFPDDSFDLVLCRAAFKNFSEPVRALQEMHRVLKPGGSALLIDLRRDAAPDAINRSVNAMGLGVVSRIITRLIFRLMLCKRAYSRQQFERMLAQTMFRDIEIREDGIGYEIVMTS
jgi:ubiquinone/menaquinone biosynthesis C-methylase UbiE